VSAGEVVFGGEKLGGGARIAVTAKAVDIRCRMAGGVHVTVTGAGRITHKDLEAGAKLIYRKALPSDADATVTGGEVRGGASVSKGE